MKPLKSRAVEVALNLPFLNGVLTYLWKEEMPPIIGLRVKVKVKNKEIKGVILRILETSSSTSYSLKPILGVIDNESIFGKNTLVIAQWISKFCFCTLGEALSFILPWAIREKKLEKQKQLTHQNLPIFLNDDQSEALQTILNSPPSSSFFLRGVTGSGKSETLLHTARYMLEKGESVLYLVPEIALSYSLQNSLERVLGDFPVFSLHSSLTASEKLSQWRAIQNSSTCCVVGVRSATFAPFNNLGLIIMDEEQESSYKSETNPRYYTRHIVFLLQKYFRSRIVLTSATPSLESYYAIKKGLLNEIILKNRIGKTKIPHVEVIKLKNSQDLISHNLTEAILDNYKKGKQAILFLNRRGFLSILNCPNCRHQKLCPNCSVPLTWHKNLDRLRCHYCNYHEHTPIQGIACPNCSYFPIQFSKIGTEFLEETLRSKFPHLRTIRLDTDVLRGNRLKIQEVLRGFEEGKWDILLGTQMIAKGLNFRKVELVGIILADDSLFLPDFRAYEKTYSLIRQVIGRAGRFSDKGLVILQTLQSDHPVIQMAKVGNDKKFYEQELAIRQTIDFPPFSQLFKLVVRGNNKEQVKQEIYRLFKILKDLNNNPSLEIFNPCECIIERMAGNWRWQILLKAKKLNHLHLLVSEGSSLWKGKRTINLYLEIDPYPINML